MTKLVCTLEHVEEEMELDLIRHRIVGAIETTRVPRCPRQSPLAFLTSRSPTKDKRPHFVYHDGAVTLSSSPFWRLISEPRLDE
ncbi:hypothetical protein HZH66_012201 [Vespula vulgaris]|uniref:Uncharacterized protein n=1 Tax=Vespula vulgaris TaxID=7454 RepID=A0A834MUN3_VESVU|nr:hypothetical protein HZH66_012201 [Vespula vulgaris]